MATRRPHKKSRKGCTACKMKHLKCDERRPNCGNCQDRWITCTYLWEKKPPPSTSSRESSQQMSGTHSQVVVSSPGASLSPFHMPQAYNIEALKLLHHYTTNVYDSLSTIVPQQKVWQTSVVQIAMRNDFLLRGILSLSALHIALDGCENPQIMVAEAAHHQNAALVEYRRLINTGDISPESQRAAFLFSAFLAMCGFCFLRADGYLLKSNKGDRGIDEFLACANLVRGMTGLHSLWAENIFSDELYATLRSGPPTDLYPDIGGDVITELRALSDLATRCKAETCTNTSEACQDAVQLLFYSFEMIRKITVDRGSMSPIIAGLMWPSRISSDFVILLTQRNPLAVLILAYFGVLLHRLDSFWFFRGWGKHLIETSVSILGDSYADLLAFPKASVRL
ncbi:uncharacterized protein EAF01_000980 [Botrytis porri]|uniref:uncharacterized protein n=1 Tax=Botrytis porri TaxID=87229 RepID=UPI0019003D92|nr:uncharacterized protein EAF01_000980 [Botrytis porri]KAF7914574.1 hypothetical protein EAF01_000980 [Botrytis porri]